MPDDLQDPLPEPSFFWRRLIVVALLLASGALVWWQAPRLSPKDTLTLLGWVLLFDFGVLTYYFAGASATDLTGLVSAFKLRVFGAKDGDK